MKNHPYSLVYVSNGQHRSISFRTKQAAIATAQTMSTPAPGSPAWTSWEFLKRDQLGALTSTLPNCEYRDYLVGVVAEAQRLGGVA